MGYTHYWQRPAELGADAFRLFSHDARGLIVEAQRRGIEVIDPRAGPNLVAFDGGCETFYLDRLLPTRELSRMYDGLRYQFCKTNGAPYDLLVTAVLVMAKYWFGDAIRVTSDGADKDWEPARSLCRDVLGYGDGFQLDKGE